MGHNLDYITDAIGKVAQDTQLFQLRGNVLKVTGALTSDKNPLGQVYRMRKSANYAFVPSAATRRGFPPSVFSELPKLMERAGNSDKGSITALYTVLVEGDDMTEPVADETRSILDGHIILSRQLAEAGHYPAIDVTASVSRVITAITDEEHQRLNQRLRELLSKRREIDLLIKVGEYKSGADKLADEAIAKHDRLNEFLRQRHGETDTMENVLERLRTIIDG